MTARSCIPAFVLALLASSHPALADAPRTGEVVYKQDCARCHGEQGQGTPEVKRALAGDKTVPQLAKLIAETMPEDDPGSLPEADALASASYIHDAFYSRAARDRMKPPRIELSRLTVRQHRNALADLVASFRPPLNWPETDRGLRGEYYKGRGFRGNGNRVLDRIDPVVDFDFGAASPEPEIFEDVEFSARWEGSVLPPDTGPYEFVVRTDHAVRLWVNDMAQGRPLIDAWVKSGTDKEFKASITLLGGRPYPIRLEFSKSKQGVDDSKNKKSVKPPPEAFITLAWKSPHKRVETIPARLLAPVKNPETFVAATPFPPDDRSVGYERGTAVSKAWDQAATDVALETAAYVASHLRDLANVRDGMPQPEREKGLIAFGRKFVDRAFRRPLPDDQAALYVDRIVKAVPDSETAAKRIVLLALKSPRFLYVEAGQGQPDGYDVAARVALGLWDSIPDKALLQAASDGKLKTREQVAAQADRMLADPRARAKLRDFLLQWLNVEHPPDLAKDPERYPQFDQAVVSDLRTSLELALDDVLRAPKADFRDLLLADEVYLNGRLALLYGADLPPNAGFRKVKLDPGARAGVLTHPYLMAAFAYTGASSPIHRGVFLTRSVLGRSLRPPPVAVAPLAPDLHASLNTRERTTLQTKAAACMSCHGAINPLGFGLEHFDAIGRFRATEKDRPIDATGVYQPPQGDPAPFDGARDLAAILAKSDETHAAFVEQLFHHLVKQPARAYGSTTLDDLRQSFRAHDDDVRKLAVDVIAATALAPRSAPPEKANGLARAKTP